ncbi:D-2-hydroxyacid dehydrogenase [Edaphobacter sp. 12200R-103]|uniref:D-2-hydroxyacid dehydrogenase n=1 Tax=Edaphobacter sp. 12200R-103 TaxID=2703788 RepID=UPI00138CFA9F|nr:D-2-hydroxyacid dehydrogenase [Edaphobacter sp. 12200R-103]QHS52061.1 D-2-hydroxyacid dehydrogenase [Edaphobacter sp. 12200R-103]
MTIVVLDGHTLNPGDNPWTMLEKLGEVCVYDRSTPSQVRERVAEADILLTNKTPLPRDIIEGASRLKFISVLATGYNIVDIAAAREKGIIVSNVPDYGTNTVAQFVMGLMLELCHHIGGHSNAVRSGAWATSKDWSFWNSSQVELYDKTLGIVGFGRIGRRVAAIAECFGMRVIYNTRTPGTELAQQYRTLQQLFSEADVVSLHCALTPENTGIVNRALLETMKPSAFLINTARGALIHEDDLSAALNSGIIAGAALDVLSSEPPSKDNPLLTARNCIITPHMAWAALDARKRIMKTTIDNVAAFLAGTPINVIS